MKLLMCVGLLLTICVTGYAQGTFSNTGSGLNDISRFIDPADSISDDNEIVSPEEDEAEEGNVVETNLDHATMEVTDSTIIFDRLPPKLVMAHITDREGETILSRNISSKRNSIGIRRLPEGVFFVTLLYKDQRKGFTIERYPEH